ncbi:MAG: MBL fold metallo-hydrolase [Desulfobacter sp.]|nr:MBL fold metallo-hydrolase [Desulfobacter sp.]WDP85763.1 MAG: MBL fold metallo-hydrolase [Desulfobacter sp.]
MRIKCWGSRGSISVSGSDYIQYGGDTTCIEVQADSGQIVIIDAGTGIRRLGKSLIQRQEKTYYLLLTHTHWDHILGIAFFHPLLYPDTCLIVQDRKFGGINTRAVFDQVMKDPFFPIRLDDFQADIQFKQGLNGQFNIGSLDIKSIPTSHSRDSLGYKFCENGRTFVFLTDNELGYAHAQSRSRQDYIDFCKGADILFHDAEYTADEYLSKTGWGHSSVSDVLDLAIEADVRQLGLIHLNQDRTDAQMDEIIKDCNRFFKNKNKTIKCFGVSFNFETTL